MEIGWESTDGNVGNEEGPNKPDWDHAALNKQIGATRQMCHNPTS